MANTDRIGRGFALLAGLGYGVGMMYLLDPEAGRRRRALIREQFTHARNQARRWLKHQLRHGVNQVQGSVAEWRARMRETQVDDEILRERVRGQIGHVVANPGSLSIDCDHGRVIVRGPVLRGERENIERRLGRTRGVLFYSLEVRDSEDDNAELGLPGKGRQRVG